jgi:predicted MPP superfamily phosphohydrolase
VSRRLAEAAATAAAAGLAWALYEAQWVELREVEVPLDRLPAALDGFTILHLSDFHLGTVLNGRTLERTVEWAREGRTDIVALTGDLLSRQRGEGLLHAAIRALEARHGVFAVLGNHDVDVTRDPFSTPTDASGVEDEGAVLLEDASVLLRVNGHTVQIAGGDPRRDWKHGPLGGLADAEADLRILLFHFPDVVRYLPAGAFDLILAGHLHGGQICLPFPGGRIRLEHLRAQHWEGVHSTPAGLLHVSRGLGTSLVPIRFLARPEATRLVLRRPG